jgi:hypothetical protein
MDKVKRFILRQWKDVKGNAKWTFVTSALGAGGWVWYYWDYYRPRMGALLMVVIPPVEAWIEELSGSYFIFFTLGVMYLLFTTATSIVLMIDAVRNWRLNERKKGEAKGEVELLSKPGPEFTFEKITQELWWKEKERNDLHLLTSTNPAPSGASLVIIVTVMVTSTSSFSLERAELHMEGQGRFPALRADLMFHKLISRQDEIPFRFDIDSDLPCGPYAAFLVFESTGGEEWFSSNFPIRITRSYSEY